MNKFVIQYVPQPDFYTCDEACLAMVANIPIEEAILVMEKYRGSGSSAFYKAFKTYKIDYLSWRSIDVIDELPPLCILLIQFSTYSHTVVYYDGVYYDPEFGVLESCKAEGKITHYMELFIDRAYEGKDIKIKIPDDFQEAFEREPGAYQAFLNLSYSGQSKLINKISHYKNPEVRLNNITKLLGQLV